MPETLAQITAPHFCAGLVIQADRCTEAAPILAWAIGWTRDELRGVFCLEGMAGGCGVEETYRRKTVSDIDTSYEPGDTPKVMALKHAISELRHKLSIAAHSAAPDVFSYSEQFRPLSELQAVVDNTPSPERLVLRGYSTVKRDPATGKMHIVSKAGNNVEEGITYRYFLEAGFIKRHDWPTVAHDLLKRAVMDMAKYYTGR